MSSSKVFRRTSSFIPEQIFSQKGKKGSGWKSVAIPIDQEDAITEHGYSGIDRNEGPGSVHRTDFTIPDASSKTYGETEASPLDINLTPALTGEKPDLQRQQEEVYNTGLRDGLKMAEEDFGSSTKALVMACEQINSLRETILNNSMEEMQNLVLIIAEKIIRHSVTEQDRTIVDTVEEAIRHAVKSDEFLIQVNPADLAVIKAKSKEFTDSLSGLENIVVQANPAIERGGCIIDSSTSTVDATLTSQLHIIEDKIKGKT